MSESLRSNKLDFWSEHQFVTSAIGNGWFTATAATSVWEMPKDLVLIIAQYFVAVPYRWHSYYGDDGAASKPVAVSDPLHADPREDGYRLWTDQRIGSQYFGRRAFGISVASTKQTRSFRCFSFAVGLGHRNGFPPSLCVDSGQSSKQENVSGPNMSRHERVRDLIRRNTQNTTERASLEQQRQQRTIRIEFEMYPNDRDTLLADRVFDIDAKFDDVRISRSAFGVAKPDRHLHTEPLESGTGSITVGMSFELPVTQTQSSSHSGEVESSVGEIRFWVNDQPLVVAGSEFPFVEQRRSFSGSGMIDRHLKRGQPLSWLFTNAEIGGFVPVCDGTSDICFTILPNWTPPPPSS